jgi:predicted secreted hydrolase
VKTRVPLIFIVLALLLPLMMGYTDIWTLLVVAAEGTASSNQNSNTPFELSYDTQNITHRSAFEEWQPHRGQTATSQEWWYVTALLHDASGNQYLLFNTIFKYDGKDIPNVSSAPEFASRLGPNTTIISPAVELSEYNTGFHFYDSDGVITSPNQIWDSKNNTLIYKTPRYSGLWSFDGDSLNSVLRSQNLSFVLNMQGGNQVMWAKDVVYNKEGFIQQGLPGNVSFYYSLPRLFISGNLTYLDESGNNKTVDVAGLGWVDRQWGDFKTEAWEWNSFRFDNGARLNLYNFANAYKVGTYQKADGSTQWLDDFIIKQNGYARAPNGQWVALGWSFEFPTDIEGSKHYSVVPFSKNSNDNDWICDSPDFCFIEGAGSLIDDTDNNIVGSSVFESMDIRLLRNGPYDINQH